MTTGRRRRTLGVRGWFALAALATFVVIAGIPAGAYLLAGDEPQDRAASAARVLRDDADRWHDPEWRDATAADLGADHVQFVLFEGGDELYRSTIPDGASTAADGPPWGTSRDDGIVRFLEVDGTRPPLTAQVYTPLDDDDFLVGITLATIVFGAVAGAVALAFGRPFIRPLRAARQAADQVTNGDLSVSLPGSRVTEIHEVNVAFDIMTTELRDSIEKQAALEHERRLFIAAIAHDLRTPLFSLRGYLDGLQTGIADSPEKRAHYLTVANEKARTLEQIVSDLFDYTRLTYLDQPPDAQRTDLADLLREHTEGFRPQAEAKHLTLGFQPPDQPCPIDADRHQLGRAVGNILDNAVRHTPPGGRIDVACGASGEATWFTISDTGPGIAPHDLPHIFEPLYRGDSARGSGPGGAGPGGSGPGGSGAGGAGLGLAIAHRILAAHHGTLHARNDPAGGATLTATIPTASG